LLGLIYEEKLSIHYPSMLSEVFDKVYFLNDKPLSLLCLVESIFYPNPLDLRLHSILGYLHSNWD